MMTLSQMGVLEYGFVSGSRAVVLRPLVLIVWLDDNILLAPGVVAASRKHK